MSYILFKNKDYTLYYLDTKYKNKTTPLTEYNRHKLYKNLTNDILKYLDKKDIKLSKSGKNNKTSIDNNLAMFIAVNMLEKKSHIDPLFPSNIKYSQTLIKTISHLSGLSLDKSQKIYKDLDLEEKFKNIVKKISKLNSSEDDEKVYKKNKFLYYRDIKLEISDKLYKKLRSRYNGKKDEFLSHVFCLILRYKTFGGNSHQFSMEIKFKKILREKYGINFELFASSINVYYDNYCSLFYDIEKHFGSFGNFYHLKLIKGFFIANPPYETILLEKMVNKFIKSIRESDQALSITFGLPNWGEYERFIPLEKVQKSKYLSYIRCMKKGEVWWYDSFKNMRIKIPSHCRSVIQNEKGRKLYDIKDFNDLINKYWVIIN